MADKPHDREAHIRRYIGTNANGDKLTDLWADMYRIDKFSTIYNGGLGVNHDAPTNQKVRRTFFWNDDPAGSSGGTGNEHVVVDFILKLCSPDEDPTNPSEWIEIPITKSMMTKASRLSGTGNQNDQKKRVVFHTPNAESSNLQDREVAVVKVTHFDTNMDNDDTFKNGGVVPYDQYEKLQGTEDESNYVNACIVLSYKAKASHESGTGNQNDQKKTWRIHNGFIVDMFKAADVSTPPFDPPWTFDPYQLLFNVNLGGLAVEFLDGAA